MDRGQSQGKRKRAEEESIEGASTSSSISPESIDACNGQYDVFLSFRGSDTRKAFTDHLYHSLIKAGMVRICVFKDDKSIPIGKEFGSQILDAITRSKISIPIISENYASSKWCLRELTHIMDCKKRILHMVLPIFYKVEPSDVRYLKGSFGEAFHSHKNRFDKEEIQEVERALREVSDLQGWESEKFANGYFTEPFSFFDKHEGELVEKVVENILSKLRQDFQLDVTKYLVGIGDHVNKIRKWIDSPTGVARMIGIYGMGGIGKTTLAKAIYNQLSNDFMHRSFLADIRETAHRNNMPLLQKQLIEDIQGFECQVGNGDYGISLIKSTFKGKKVLLLLDDIDDKNQLDALARERDWFVPGSMIIVTTRNEAVLDQSEFEVDYKYELNGLDMVHALLLFNRHAFRMDHSPKDFDGISRDIIFTIGGLPLALEVVGSYLYKKKGRRVWEDVRKRLKNQPHRDVQKILQISYDALDDGDKQIFLDIACFLIDQRSEYAIYMWEDCGLYPIRGIEELKLRCLIKIDYNGFFKMNGQVRDLGRSIFGQRFEISSIPGDYDYEGFPRALMNPEATDGIRGICLDKYHGQPLRPRGHAQTYTDKQFKSLRSLRFLQLRAAALSGDFDKLFSELRWLQWFDIDPNLCILATNLHLPKLVALQLSYNHITEHWGGWDFVMVAKRLKVLDLAFCNYLRCTPDLSAFTLLEILILKHCDGMEQLHPSIGRVNSLVSLDLSDCGSLKEIPTSISSLRKLEKLSARGCRLLREIPSSIGDLQNLRYLDISESAIEKLPNTIGRLMNLQTLSLESCQSLKGEIPSEIGDLSSLEIFKITRAPISNLPESIWNLSSLRHLSLMGCYELQSLPKLPSGLTYLTVSCQCPRLPHLSCLINLEQLDIYGCDLLEYIPKLPSKPLKLCVTSCHNLTNPKFDGFKYLKELSVRYCSSIKRLDFSQLDCLKRLHVEYCYDLLEIQGHDFLNILEEIVIDCCKSIERLILPELRCLKQLKANYCHNLVEIRGLDRAKSLEVLDISDCGSIERLPDLPCFLTLKELNINDCHNLRSVESLERFLSCRSIYITGCKSLEKLPNLSKFEKLENFTMRYSLGVTKIPGVEKSRSLTHIDITGCESMETLPDLSRCEKLQSLLVRDCKKLTQLQGLDKLDLLYLDISGCDSLKTIPTGTSVFRHYEGQRYGLFHKKINLCDMISLQ